MECRDYRKKIPEYLAGVLSCEESEVLEAHLNHCPRCKGETESFEELDRLIDAAGLDIPMTVLNEGTMQHLTGSIMKRVKAGSHMVQTGRRKSIASLLQDLVAAAAAAIIIFWFSGPVLAGNSTTSYSQKVVTVSNSVGVMFQAYVDMSSSALDKLSDTIDQISPAQMKGVDK